MNDMAKNIILWVVIAIVLVSVFNNFGPPQVASQQLPYSEFIANVKNGNVQKVVIEGRTVQGVYQSGEKFVTYSPGDNGLVGDLLDKGVVINRPPRDGHMAFIRSPDDISIELLQAGDSLPPQEPWASMTNTFSW